MQWFCGIPKRWRSVSQFVGLFFLGCLLIVSCSVRPASQSQGSPSGTPGSNRLILGTIANIRTLDPADAYELWAGNLLYNLGDRLYTYELGGTTLKPQLATAMPQVSPDGLTYKIPLRQGVVFHDGTPFNAEAMAFSLRRFMQNGGQPAFLLTDTIASIQATKPDELTITLKRPFTAFPALLAFSGLCAVSPKSYEIGSGKFKPKEFVGTGPYRLTQYGSDSLKLEAFDRYWGEKPANPGIDIQRYSSPANLYNALQTGAVDVAYQTLDPDQIQSLQQNAARSGLQVIEGQGSGVYYLTLNLKSKPLDQLAVRQALAAMVDRPLLSDRVFRGQAEPLYSLLPQSMEGSNPVFKDQYGDSNVAKAKAALQQAGYSKEKPLVLELWYRSNIASNQLTASTLKAAVQAKLDGAMQLELKGVESATAYQNLDKGAYPIFILDWTPDFFDPDTYIQPFMECTRGSVETGCQEGSSKLQGSFYYNDRVNQLIAKTRQEKNSQARQKIFRELQDILGRDVPFIPLWQNKEYLFVRQGTRGARLEVTQKVPFWTLQKS